MNVTDARQAQYQEQIKELFFKAGDKILRPVVQSLNEVYPMSKRMDRFPSYDPELAAEHDLKFRKARNILYEQRNLVQRVHLKRYVVRLAAGDESEASVEMRALVVENALDRVYEMLIAYLPVLLPADHLKTVMETIRGIFEYEHKQLTKSLQVYAADFAPGVTPHEMELD